MWSNSAIALAAFGHGRRCALNSLVVAAIVHVAGGGVHPRARSASHQAVAVLVVHDEAHVDGLAALWVGRPPSPGT